MKVVLDTNVLVSGIIWHGQPEKIIEMAIEKQISLFATEEILTEYFRILEKLHKADLSSIAEWKFFLLEIINLIESEVTITDCRDPKDNMFLECAVSSGSSFIITGDADLLVLNPYLGISILNPTVFLTNYA